MTGDGENAALRTLLAEAAISNAALARAVVASGAEEGVHLGTTPPVDRRAMASEAHKPDPPRQ